MRVSCTERSNFSGSSAKPGAITYMRSGMAICASAVKTSSQANITAIDVFGKALGIRLAAAFEPLGEQRHEGRIEGAFGEERAEQVGKAEGDDEGLRHRPGADHGSGHHVADEAERAAHQGEPPTVAADLRRDM